jgi:hypothetical protein
MHTPSRSRLSHDDTDDDGIVVIVIVSVHVVVAHLPRIHIRLARNHLHRRAIRHRHPCHPCRRRRRRRRRHGVVVAPTTVKPIVNAMHLSASWCAALSAPAHRPHHRDTHSLIHTQCVCVCVSLSLSLSHTCTHTRCHVVVSVFGKRCACVYSFRAFPALSVACSLSCS